MKHYRILSFFFTLILTTACQLFSDAPTKKEAKKISNLDSTLGINKDTINNKARSEEALYEGLPDSIIAEIKEMDRLLAQADDEILQAAAEEAALEQQYLEHIEALDTVSLDSWKHLPPRTFKQQQLSFENVQAIYDTNLEQVRKSLIIKGIYSFNIDLYLRAFKEEGILELWAKPKREKKYTLITTYPFFQGISTLGPKQREGDRQVLEGVYVIDYFNPNSLFNISLCIDYPNAADVIRNVEETKLGSAICIHGGEASVGCLVITDLRIPNVYILATEAKDKGQEKIPIHIFPAQLTSEKLQELEKRYEGNIDFIAFWRSIQLLYTYFEEERALPVVKTTSKGIYKVEIP